MKTILRSLFFLWLGLFFTEPLLSQWVRTNGPYGSYVTSFVPVGPNLFASTWLSGIFLSTDHCMNWLPVNNGLPPRLAVWVVAARGQDLFAGTDQGGVFRSTDNGSSWHAVFTGRPDEGIGELAFVGTSVFAASGFGVYRSLDDSVWSQVASFSASAFAVNGTNLFAGTGAGMYLSTNNGTSWTSVDHGLGSDVRAIIFLGTHLFAGTSTGVYRSTNNGTDWVQVSPGLTYVSSFTVRGTNLFAGTEGGIFVSSDDGTSWNPVSTGLTDGARVIALAANGTDVVAGTSNGVFLSTNDGANWCSMSTGMPSQGVVSLASGLVDAGDPRLFAGADNGIFLSTNNGSRWDPVLAPMGILSLAIRGTRVFAGSAGGWGFYQSLDSGATWNSVGSVPSTTWFMSLVVRGENIFAGTNSNVLLSTNNGINWLTTGLTNTLINALTFSGTTLIAGSYYGGVFLSTNNGTNWSTAGLLSSPVYALAVNGEYIFAGTGGDGVFRSPNNDMNWSQVNSGLTNTSVWSLAVSGANLLAGTNGGVFVSTNNGTSWTAFSEGLTDTTVDVLCIGGVNVFAAIAEGNGPGRKGAVWRRPLSEIPDKVEETHGVPSCFVLHQNFPNPFNPATTIGFSLPSKSFVSLRVMDVLGREVSCLVSGEMSAGSYTRQWNAAGMASGVYFYRLQAGSRVETKKLLLLR